MKITKREKLLLISLAVLLIIGSYYKFVYSYQVNKIVQLQGEKQKNEDKLFDMKRQIASIKQRETDIKIMNSKISDITKIIFPTIKQEKVIIDIDRLLDEAHLNSNTISFSEITVQPIKEKEKNKTDKKDVKNPLKDLADEYNGIKKPAAEASNEGKKKATSDISYEGMAVGLNFKGSYNDVVNFIKAVESNNKKIIISDLKLSQGATGEVTGSASLQFYAIAKITDEDKEFLKWDYNNPYGKLNPFDGIGTGSNGGSTIEEVGTAKKEQSYDFVMSVRGINSDLPTVMLGKSKDYSKKTYVYADTPSMDNVDIYFTKKDGKYYFKYKTSRDKYPAQFDGDGEEFAVSGDSINFKIYSNKRINQLDNSGANVRIYNKTDKTVSVSIDTDDNVKPRVTISGEGGNVEVKRN